MLCSSWYGASQQIFSYFNNITFTKCDSYRAGFCFTTSLNSIVGGYNIAQNNLATSFLAFYLKGNNITLFNYHFINNSCSLGWIDFYDGIGYVNLNSFLFFNNSKILTIIGTFYSGSKINIFNSKFDFIPSYSSNLYLYNYLMISNINLNFNFNCNMKITFLFLPPKFVNFILFYFQILNLNF